MTNTVPVDAGRETSPMLVAKRATYNRLAGKHQDKIEERFTGRLSNADLRALRRAMHKLGLS